MRRRRTLLAAIVGVLVLAGCGGPGEDPRSTETAHGSHHTTATAGPSEPLRDGERFLDLAMPAAYKPKAPTAAGADDYRCFLLDPKLTEDAFVTGHDVLPGRPDLVHHVILYKVEADAVADAEDKDANTKGQGWTCFGGPGVSSGGDSEFGPEWLGGWAPGGGESILAPDIGLPMEAGSRVVMQVHYNLADGSHPVTSHARLRVAPGTADLEPLVTRPMPAPVELPCRPGKTGELCDRSAAVRDVADRFGGQSGLMVLGLQLRCGGDPNRPRSGPVQSCDHEVRDAGAIRAAVGHMHLLGRSISITVNPGTPSEKVVLDIPEWDFDNQRTRMLKEPVKVERGDVLRVRCRHDQSLRDSLPAFEGLPERYVVWGEGTTDEMCLGIVMATGTGSDE